MSDIVSELRRLPNIPEGKNTWRLFLDDAEVPNHTFRHLMLVLEKPGRPALALELGWIDDGKFAYDGLSHIEAAGGGVVVVPFLIWKGELYVALVTQTRYLTGGEVETVPRGYAEIGRNMKEQADNEATEEMGERTKKWMSYELLGQPVNPNTSIHNTSRPHPVDGKRAGSRFFAREIDPDCVEENDFGQPKFKEGAVNPLDEKENIVSWRLAHWSEAMRLHDACPMNATGRLMSDLMNAGRLTVSCKS